MECDLMRARGWLQNVGVTAVRFTHFSRRCGLRCGAARVHGGIYKIGTHSAHLPFPLMSLTLRNSPIDALFRGNSQLFGRPPHFTSLVERPVWCIGCRRANSLSAHGSQCGHEMRVHTPTAHAVDV